MYNRTSNPEPVLNTKARAPAYPSREFVNLPRVASEPAPSRKRLGEERPLLDGEKSRDPDGPRMFDPAIVNVGQRFPQAFRQRADLLTGGHLEASWGGIFDMKRNKEAGGGNRGLGRQRITKRRNLVSVEHRRLLRVSQKGGTIEHLCTGKYLID